MWTALLGQELLDLRKIPSRDRVRLHSDPTTKLRCRGCEGRVHMRKSAEDARGERMSVFDDGLGPLITFAHNPGEAVRCKAGGWHCDESDDHHQLKNRLARAAEAAGWKADLEVPADGCRADVVVEQRVQQRTNRRVLEAQIAPLHAEEARRRHDLYQTAFGPTVWTHTRARGWSGTVESFQVDDEDLTTVIGGVYEDQEHRVKAEPVPINIMLPRVLHGELIWAFDRRDGIEHGAFIPLGARPRQRATGSKRQSRRGENVGECAHMITRTINCTACGHAGFAGKLCPNPTCPGTANKTGPFSWTM